ncbi:MAG: GlcNAc-PI de-N-acetylase [Anaerolineales bacterium]|nr:GlcNAc-PI de-N-acetylase [Anaerolineae bacterium]PWB55701.1 MAG: GlcNAc-PI de-N-acetylase [Anaerolineales bacterium]
MAPDVSQPFTMLVCLAHPDDETFGMGGTLALYAKKGVQVHLVCATRGDVGDVDQDLLQGFSSVAERRESELRCAAGILGLSGVYFLGYRDSGMPGTPDNQHPNALAAQPVDEVAARVVHYIRLLRPQVVVTHDPIGGYKHPDHIAMHHATLRAFQLASQASYPSDLPPFQPDKLYYQTMPKAIMRWAVRLAPLLGMDPRHFGRNRDIDLVAVVQEGSFPTHARINCRSVSEIRDQATACHTSQLGGAIGRKGPMTILRRYLGGTESFMRAYPEPVNGLHERDLFAGIASVT